MRRFRSFSILLALGAAQLTCGIAEAAPSNATPEEAVNAIVTFDRTSGGDELFNTRRVTPTMRRLLSARLARDWVEAWSTGENVFDGSFFTGGQGEGFSSYSGGHVVASSGDRATVEVLVDTPDDDGGGTRRRHRQWFSFVHEPDGWKLDDIDYAPGAKDYPHLLHARIRTFLKRR